MAPPARGRDHEAGARRYRGVRDRGQRLRLRRSADFDDAEAAGFLLPYQASHLALFRRGRLQAGETVVVHSAASGLGLAGIQLAKAAGAKVIAVAGGPEKTARCAEFGADLLIDHQAEDFVEAVLAATGDAGAEVIYDLAGGDFAERSWRCTAHGGRYLAVGFADDDNNGMTGRPLRMACIGNIDIVGVLLAWVSSVDPAMRRFGFNPFGRTSPMRSTPTCCGWRRRARSAR